MKPATRFFMILWTLAFLTTASAQNPKMIKDIYPGTGSSMGTDIGSNIFLGVKMNGYYYLPAADGVCGTEMWKTDGSAQNTVLVRDINPGPGSGLNGGYMETLGGQVGSGGIIFFSGDNGTNGFELFKTNGTSAGTVLVKNIMADKGKTVYSSTPGFFVSMDGFTCFAAAVANGKSGMIQVAYQRELMRTDGTAANTFIVKTLNPLSKPMGKHEYGTNPKWLQVWNNVIYFYGYSGGDTNDSLTVCRSDGTSNGTYRLMAPVTFKIDGSQFIWYSLFCPAGSWLYFVADDWTHGLELWKTDGTGAGTAMVKDINPSGNSIPRHLVEMNGMLYFAADNGTNGRELWKSDGTAQGTVMVKDINPGAAGSNPSFLTAVGSMVYFTAAGESNTRQLWKSDGTEAGTVLVKTINPTGDCDLGTPSENPGYEKSRFAVAGNKIYFRATDGVNGVEPWVSDGTESGTYMLKDIYPGSTGSTPAGVREFYGKILWTANHPDYGWELWLYDPSQPLSKEKRNREQTGPSLPRLGPNYPNPFNPETTIEYFLPEPGRVTLRVYDLLGREMGRLVEGYRTAGEHQATWNAQSLSSGMYICRLESGGRAATLAIHLVK